MKDKKPFSSKKFVAFFLTLLVISGILITALMTQTFGWPLTMFMCIGIAGICSLAIGYNINQRAADTFLYSIKELMPNKRDDDDTTT